MYACFGLALVWWLTYVCSSSWHLWIKDLKEKKKNSCSWYWIIMWFCLCASVFLYYSQVSLIFVDKFWLWEKKISIITVFYFFFDFKSYMKQKSLNNQENKHIFDIILSLPQYIGSTIAIAIFTKGNQSFCYISLLWSHIFFCFVSIISRL